jgi:ATP-dependent exoDNAse (exonuclease V) alpha subunit
VLACRGWDYRGKDGAHDYGPLHCSDAVRELVLWAQQGYASEQGPGKNGRSFELAGVPAGLCDELSGRSPDTARFIERFRARHGRAPRQHELPDAPADTATDPTLSATELQRRWQEAAERHGLDPSALRLTGIPHRGAEHTAADRIEAYLAARDAVFDVRALRAVALEQTAGEMPPETALSLARSMIGDRIIALEGGRLTTRTVRGRERAIERRVSRLARSTGREPTTNARARAVAEVQELIGGRLNPEQRQALRVLTGPERAAALIGPAGTGKGVVIDAAARAEQYINRETIGVTVSWSTAERLEVD